jgi:hypothetical protein
MPVVAVVCGGASYSYCWLWLLAGCYTAGTLAHVQHVHADYRIIMIMIIL